MFIMSARPPAISVPIGPPATTTKFRAPCSTSLELRSQPRRRPGSGNAAVGLLVRSTMEDAFSFCPSRPKKVACDPAAQHQEVSLVALALASDRRPSFLLMAVTSTILRVETDEGKRRHHRRVDAR